MGRSEEEDEMILALEGPDRAGKTSVFDALKGCVDAVYVPSLSLPDGVPAGLLVSKLAELWEQLYDDSRLYVCDRSLFVSGPVYAALSGSEFPYDWWKWKYRVRVVYIDAPDAVLEARCVATGEPFDAARLHRLRECYAEVLKEYKCLRLDGTRSIESLVREVLRWL